MNQAPITVIIPCYCSAHVLSRAVDSVLRQTLLPTEIIIVDDASPDHGETKRCIDLLMATNLIGSGVRIITHFLTRNLGPGLARNVGWDLASQTYVAFLDADDSWAQDKLAIQYAWMLMHPDFKLSCHDSSQIDKVKQISKTAQIKYREINPLELFISNPIFTRTVMIQNCAEFRFSSTIRYAEDYWLWLKIANQGFRMGKINLILAFSFKPDYTGGGLSSNLIAMHQGVLMCYEDLQRQHLIGPTIFILATFLEKIKFLKRRIISWLSYEQ